MCPSESKDCFKYNFLVKKKKKNNIHVRVYDITNKCFNGSSVVDNTISFNIAHDLVIRFKNKLSFK